MRRKTTGYEDDRIQAEGIKRVIGMNDVAYMNRVEGAAV
jgi:hypothetical protein